MILQCGHCGAPLDIEARHTVFTCRYCKTKSERQKVRTIAETTPKDFEPPKVWRPPAEFPADSATELKYEPAKGSGCVFAIFGVILIPIAIAITGGLGGFDTGEGTIAALTLDKTVKQLDDDADGKPSTDALYVAMRSSHFKAANFGWDHDHPEHVRTISLTGTNKPNPDFRAALSRALPGGFDEGGSWRWEKVSLSCDETGGLYAEATIADNTLWKEQVDALWKIVVKSAFGKGELPSQADMRRLFGAGYPFADLAKLAPTTTVDKAVVETQKIFPGAVKTGDIVLVIGVDHPLFSRVELTWDNQRNATLKSVHFMPHGASFPVHQERFVQCLSKTFFAPTVSDTDFLKKTKSYQFKIASSVLLDVYDAHVSLNAYSEKLDPAVWKTLIAAIADCSG